MIRSKICLTIVALAFATSAKTQHFGLSRLFYPNVTLGAEYQSTAKMGNQVFGTSHTSVLAVVPLRSEVDVSFSLRKKFDLRARHSVLIGNFSQIDPTINDRPVPRNGYKSAMVGVVMLQASIRDRLWVYAIGGGLTESNETFFTPQPYFYGGAARMRILGVNRQVLYGSAVVYSQKFRIIPVLGANIRFNKEWRLSALLPFRANVNYRTNGWLNFDATVAYGGFSAGFQEFKNTETLLRRNNFTEVRFSLAANANLLTIFNVSIEAGLSTFRSLRNLNTSGEILTSNAPAAAPFIGATVRYITSKANAKSAFANKMGLGGEGINW